jgi:molecular chaperone GrpE
MKRTKKQSSDAPIEADELLDAEGKPTEDSPTAAEAENGGPSADAEAPANASEALQARVESLENSLLRAKADYQNLQRRVATERADAVWFASAGIMRSLVSVLDDLERSLDAARGLERKDSLMDGVRLVHTNLIQALRTHGLEPIEALHQPFDPQIHEAMLQQPAADHPPGTVIEEIAKGYRLRGRVIRPTKVIVSKAEEPPAKEEAGEGADVPEPGADPVQRDLDTEA